MNVLGKDKLFAAIDEAITATGQSDEYFRGMTFSDIPGYPPEIAALAEAVEPLHDYMLKYGDPHTKVTVTQYGARLETEGIYIPFVKSGGSDRSAEFEREIKEIVEGVER